jgi:phosphoribosylaminoimidazole-succinocarboxamide synthase
MIKAELAKYGCELYDIKLEFGRNQNQVILIDEISGGNMRVYRNGKILKPLKLVSILLD